MNIEEIQKQLQFYNIDGWLLYDFHGKNPLALEVMKVPKEMLMTRRCFYWIQPSCIELEVYPLLHEL